MSGNKQFLSSKSVGYSNMSLTAPISIDANKQFLLHSANLYNNSGSASLVGLFNSVSTSDFKVFTLGASDVEVTSTIQAGSAITAFPTTNNYGLLVQSKKPFEAIAFNIAQAQTGSPVYTYEYYNGSGWASLVVENTPVYSATGVMALVFQAPVDWAVGDSTEGGDETLYSVRMLATTAPSQAVTFDSLKVLHLLQMQEIADKASLEVDFSESPLLLQAGEVPVPFFSYTSTRNRIDLSYKINP